MKRISKFQETLLGPISNYQSDYKSWAKQRLIPEDIVASFSFLVTKPIGRPANDKIKSLFVLKYEVVIKNIFYVFPLTISLKKNYTYE